MSREVLKDQMGFNFHVIKRNTEGLTHEESLRAPQPAGNCLNWVLGHILTSRGGILELLGNKGVLTSAQQETYRRGSQPLDTSSEPMPLEKILEGLEQTQTAIVAGLEALDDEALSKLVPESPSGRDQETVEKLLAGLVFHESYHVGQTGLLRRLAGHQGAIT